MEDIDYIGANELVFNTNKDSNIHSGGFSVKSIMMGNGMSPIMTLNSENKQGGGNKVYDLFESLVIPNWVLTYNKTSGGTYKNESDDDEEADDVDDDLHDKLLGLVDGGMERQKPKKKTRKPSLLKKGGTKKNKNSKKE